MAARGKLEEAAKMLDQSLGHHKTSASLHQDLLTFAGLLINEVDDAKGRTDRQQGSAALSGLPAPQAKKGSSSSATSSSGKRRFW